MGKRKRLAAEARKAALKTQYFAKAQGRSLFSPQNALRSGHDSRYGSEPGPGCAPLLEEARRLRRGEGSSVRPLPTGKPKTSVMLKKANSL